MAIEVMAFAVGAILVMTAILGGGFEVKELKVPRVGPLARVGSAIFGLLFVFVGIGMEQGTAGSPEAPAAEVATVAPAPVPVGNAYAPVQARRLEPATDAWLEQVNSQLADIDAWARQQGLSLSHEIQSGAAGAGEEQTIALELDAGQSYGIMGVCDNDCSDLDLQLLDEAGNVLLEDLEVDAYPALLVQPEVTGTFYATVRMVSCSQAPCRYGLAVYR